jgi:hypothetical protein
LLDSLFWKLVSFVLFVSRSPVFLSGLERTRIPRAIACNILGIADLIFLADLGGRTLNAEMFTLGADVCMTGRAHVNDSYDTLD